MLLNRDEERAAVLEQPIRCILSRRVPSGLPHDGGMLQALVPHLDLLFEGSILFCTILLALLCIMCLSFCRRCSFLQ